MESSNHIKTWRDLENKVLDVFLRMEYKAIKSAKIKGIRVTHEVDVMA